MRRFPLSLAVGFVFLASAALHGQTADAPPPKVTVCPSAATLGELITALDAAVSGPANQDRTCLRGLFTADARLIPIRIGPDGAATPRILSVDDWINLVAKRGNEVFYERQIKVTAESWDRIAHLWSTYETRTTPDGKPPEGKVIDRGINSIQAIFDGKQWHVIEIVWQAQTPVAPVPEKYLP